MERERSGERERVCVSLSNQKHIIFDLAIRNAQGSPLLGGHTEATVSLEAPIFSHPCP